ncbi:MAG: hypothetical protein HQ485_14015 [Acidobacteria bacterium]|nr:hypothetical protein [Acidobacteriota bacterium]
MSVVNTGVVGTVLWACVSAGLWAQVPLPIGTRVGVNDVSGYDSQGRRDPFASLVIEHPTAAPPVVVTRAAGLAGVAIADVHIKGIIASGPVGGSGQLFLALIAGPAGVTYLARPRDRLHDAVIRRIDRDGVVFLAQVADETGATRGREVRKTLRPSTGESR